MHLLLDFTDDTLIGNLYFFYAIPAAVLVYYAQHDKKGRHDMVMNAVIFFIDAQKAQKSPASRQGRY